MKLVFDLSEHLNILLCTKGKLAVITSVIIHINFNNYFCNTWQSSLPYMSGVLNLSTIDILD